MSERTVFKTYCFAIVIVRHPETKKFLAVKETRKKGWWLPAGAVDNVENFEVAAVRETKEEGGLDIDLKGILHIDYSVFKGMVRHRVIFYAEPKDPNQPPKSIPDSESEEARWVTLDEYSNYTHLRGKELLKWGKYLEDGGLIFPLSLMTREGHVPKPEECQLVQL